MTTLWTAARDHDQCSKADPAYPVYQHVCSPSAIWLPQGLPLAISPPHLDTRHRERHQETSRLQHELSHLPPKAAGPSLQTHGVELSGVLYPGQESLHSQGSRILARISRLPDSQHSCSDEQFGYERHMKRRSSIPRPGLIATSSGRSPLLSFVVSSVRLDPSRALAASFDPKEHAQ